MLNSTSDLGTKTLKASRGSSGSLHILADLEYQTKVVKKHLLNTYATFTLGTACMREGTMSHFSFLDDQCRKAPDSYNLE